MRAVPIVLAVAIGSCQTAPRTYDVERSRTYEKAKSEVWSELMSALAESGIDVVSADQAAGVIRATRTAFQDQGWADCPRVYTRDRSGDTSRPTLARPVDRDLALDIRVGEAGGATVVQLDARLSEQKIDSHRNWPFRAKCQSTGTLEATILNAIGPAPAPTAPATSAPGDA